MNYGILLAGGKGTRLGGDIPKQLLPLGDKRVIQWSVDTFIKSKLIDGIIIVAEKNSLNEIYEIFSNKKDYSKVIDFVEGGQERSDSSYNALISRVFNDDDIVLFHDVARPFVNTRMISDLINAVKKSQAAGTYIPATDTITEISNDTVLSIPDRKTLYYTQTPQAFFYRLIREAHEKNQKNKSISVTDDASLIINTGGKVHAVKGSSYNIKITTEFDYKLATFLSKINSDSH